MNKIYDLITSEENKLHTNISCTHKINIIFNLIDLKNENGHTSDNYKLSKCFITNYIESIKIEDYGYDNFNFLKIEKILGYLNPSERFSFLQYCSSVMAKELPDHNREWFIEQKNKSEFKCILCERNFRKYPKAFFLYFGMNLWRLSLILFIFYLIVYFFLLPAPYNSWSIFEITYENYSNNFYINHFLNILSLFSDLNNNFIISPEKPIGLFLIVISKISFIVLLVNFIYRRFTDKISLK